MRLLDDQINRAKDIYKVASLNTNNKKLSILSFLFFSNMVKIDIDLSNFQFLFLTLKTHRLYNL